MTSALGLSVASVYGIFWNSFDPNVLTEPFAPGKLTSSEPSTTDASEKVEKPQSEDAKQELKREVDTIELPSWFNPTEKVMKKYIANLWKQREQGKDCMEITWSERKNDDFKGFLRLLPISDLNKEEIKTLNKCSWTELKS
nr:hypothetical protein [Candidatus Mycoplasma haematolamae]